MTAGTIIVTGAGGLVGSESVAYFIEAGFRVVGIDNDMRSYFFGEEASTAGRVERLERDYHGDFRCERIDIRDQERIDAVIRREKRDLVAVIHTAAQPSHDWAAKQPHLDFDINARSTLNLLQAVRDHVPDATFVFTSTNKVYGDRPNDLPLLEQDTRYELPSSHKWFKGIDTSMSVDRSLHSLFGVSKLAADLLVQEYGRYFQMPTVCFRAGCLTGPRHDGAELHGFLSYLVRCAVSGREYTIYGYKGKQVRDNLHSRDLVRAFHEVIQRPRIAAVYNIGGGRASNCSVLEAIEVCREVTGRELRYDVCDRARKGDHIWWISDNSIFQADYPGWRVTRNVRDIIEEIVAENAERWVYEQCF